MTRVQRFAALAGIAGMSLLGTAASHNTPGFIETDLVVNQIVGNVPTLTDANGIVHVAKIFDPHLINPWGISESTGSPFWVSDNGDGTSSLFSTNGPIATVSLLVSIPSPDDPTGNGGTPTGQAFDIATGPGIFPLTGISAAGTETTQSALFLFATEDGTIAGWNPGVSPLGVPPAPQSTHAIIAVDHSSVPDSCHGAVYKGLAIAKDASSGATYLYAANFRAGTIEVFDTSFHPVTFSADAFTDTQLPRRYAPFNIVLVGNELFVTYAKRDKAGTDDVAGKGHGFVDVYDLEGHLLRRFASRHELDSPWGVAVAPAAFGSLAGDILIGNFGNGRIHAFDPGTGDFLGALHDPQGHPIVIDGLWALQVGNGQAGGDRNTLYFSAGPNDEADGLFGSLNLQ